MNLLGKAPSWIEVEGFTIGEVPWLKDFLHKDLLDYFHSFTVFLCCDQTVSITFLHHSFHHFFVIVCVTLFGNVLLFFLCMLMPSLLCVFMEVEHFTCFLPLHFTCLDFFSLIFPFIFFIPKRFVVHRWRMLLTSLNERELRSESLMGLAPLLIHWISKFLNSWMQFLQMTRTLFHTHQWILIW
jgi:hypothetical protein